MDAKTVFLGFFMVLTGVGLISARTLFAGRIQKQDNAFGRVNSRHSKATSAAPVVIGSLMLIAGLLLFAGVLSAE
ncbi:hypothetical protein ACFQ61_13645 [Streptomyces sp. NPDC056500]|uniref:hypothetical protein n=1 Tax=Streptomyces sp. NPDC056500 TaxID=3345840 RepID=UPI0036A7EB1A